MIQSHLPLARAIARRHAGRGEEFDDLVQIGAVGLIKASNRFDPSRGVAFAAFASPLIDGEIRRHLRDRARPVRIPRELERMRAEVRGRRDELAATLGRSPTVSELAAALGGDERDVERALGAERALDSVSISSEDATVALPAGGEALSGSEDRLLLASTVRSLDERERRIVFLRFHADLTEREIARELGISQAHVSRLLTGALAKLREELGGPDGDGDAPDGGFGSAPVDAKPGAVDTTDDTADTTADRAERPGRDGAQSRLPAVGASENPTLGQYLELPYHLDVRREHEGSRSWWKASVQELPGCAAQGDTPDEAVARLRPAMESWLKSAMAEDREIPTPSEESGRSRSQRSHSGRFLVRMPSSLHEQLARAAEREQVSLNRLVTDLLAASVARSESGEPLTVTRPPGETDQATAPRHPPAREFRIALATNLVVVVIAGVVALVLLALALARGI